MGKEAIHTIVANTNVQTQHEHNIDIVYPPPRFDFESLENSCAFGAPHCIGQ